jgi:hypothetical protein
VYCLVTGNPEAIEAAIMKTRNIHSVISRCTFYYDLYANAWLVTLPDQCQHSIPGALSASNQDPEIPRAAVEELFSDVGKWTNRVGHLSGQ